MNRRGAAGLGVTVGELRAAIAKLPATMRIVVRPADGVHGAVWNAGVDTLEVECGCMETWPQLVPGSVAHGIGCAREGTITPLEVLALEVSDDPDFVRVEDARREVG